MDNLISRARRLAIEFHKGQYRKHGLRQYVYHPAWVAKYLKSKGYSDEVLLAAAFCHDLLEDVGPDLYNTLEEQLGSAVAQLVNEVTQPAVDKRLSRNRRWPIYLEHYAKASLSGQILKLADRRCNLQEYLQYWHELSLKEKRFLDEVYLDETIELVEAIGAADRRIMYEIFDLSNIIDYKLSKDLLV